MWGIVGGLDIVDPLDLIKGNCAANITYCLTPKKNQRISGTGRVATCLKTAPLAKCYRQTYNEHCDESLERWLLPQLHLTKLLALFLVDTAACSIYNCC